MTLYTNSDALAKCSERQESDFYPTPIELIYSTCNMVYNTLNFAAYDVLDVGCGDGRWLQVLKQFVKPWKSVGIDIRSKDVINLIPGATDEFIEADYLTYPFEMLGKSFDLVIGNIPYNKAEDIIRKAYYELNPGGYIVQLLLLNFLGSQTRMKGLFEEIPLEAVYVLGKRPSFLKHIGKSGTDAREYAIFVWHKTDEKLVPQIKWLEW